MADLGDDFTRAIHTTIWALEELVNDIEAGDVSRDGVRAARATPSRLLAMADLVQKLVDRMRAEASAPPMEGQPH